MKMLLKHSVQLKLLWEASRANHSHLQTKTPWKMALLSVESPCTLLRSEFTGVLDVLMAPFCSGSERRADVCIIADSSVAIQDCSGNSLEEHV